jgi:iron complex transport system permease protein
VSAPAKATTTGVDSVGRGRTRPLVALVISLTLLIAVAALSMVAGSKGTNVFQVWDVLLGEGDDYLREVVKSRFPRTVVGAVVGASLAVAGVIIQGITRNPLGDPGLLGVTVGASAAVVTATAFLGFAGGAATVWVAVPGALLTVLLVYVVGARAQNGSLVPLVLAGAVVGAVLGTYIQAMTLTRPEVFDSYRYWVIGSLAGRDLSTAAAIGPVVIIGLIMAFGLASGLNALALGDEVATSLGVRVPWIRGGGILAATLLSAAATAAVGPIAFVGLAVPHVVRALFGTDHRWQIPGALVLGATLLISADIIGRLVARPGELMVGVVTAFLGAPFLLWAVRSGRAVR